VFKEPDAAQTSSIAVCSSYTASMLIFACVIVQFNTLKKQILIVVLLWLAGILLGCIVRWRSFRAVRKVSDGLPGAN
jgi:hypothetical protein